MTVGEYLEDYEEHFLNPETSAIAKDVLFKELDLEIHENAKTAFIASEEDLKAFIRIQVRKQNKKCNLMVKLFEKKHPGLRRIIKKDEFGEWWYKGNPEYKGEISE